MAVQADREAYEVGPELLAAGKLPLAPSGMAFGGENGPDPAAYDIMNTDDFGIWQNKTMDSSSGSHILVEASIPGCARSSRTFFGWRTPLCPCGRQAVRFTAECNTCRTHIGA